MNSYEFKELIRLQKELCMRWQKSLDFKSKIKDGKDPWQCEEEYMKEFEMYWMPLPSPPKE